MNRTISIGLIGDYDAGVTAHQAIPSALSDAAQTLGITIHQEWLATDRIASETTLPDFDGLWCVPASPYRSMRGALLAIRHARERGVPFLGTCGGFQHAVVEYARNVLDWKDAEHAEIAPDAKRAVISPLLCSLVEKTDAIRLFAGSRIASAYGVSEIVEGYHCRYGLNPDFRTALLSGPMRASADDALGEVRAIELDGHPFYVATLFQPERAGLRGRRAPLVEAFVRATATVTTMA